MLSGLAAGDDVYALMAAGQQRLPTMCRPVHAGRRAEQRLVGGQLAEELIALAQEQGVDLLGEGGRPGRDAVSGSRVDSALVDRTSQPFSAWRGRRRR